MSEPRENRPDDRIFTQEARDEIERNRQALLDALNEPRLTRAEWEASTEVVVSGSVTTILDYEAAGWAYWNEERIGSTEPDKPPFDDYEKFKDIWVERARKVLAAALNVEEDS